MHISKKEAHAEAIRIAETFLAANIPEGSSWDWKCLDALPDVLGGSHKHRKTVIKWIVCVRWIPKGGGVFDGDGIVKVDIETKQARWVESP